MEDGGQDSPRSPDARGAGLPDELLETSDALLARIRELRHLEERKRAKGISTEEFQHLAEEVERRALEIWQIAADEGVIGERERAARNDTDRGVDRTIQDIERRRKAGGDGRPQADSPADPE